MNKATLDVVIMSVALLAGAFLSLTSNPLLGVALLVSILLAWSYAPKASTLIKSPVVVKTHMHK